MITARIMVFAKDRTWDWEETFPELPRMGETLRFIEAEEDDPLDDGIYARIREIEWQYGTNVNVLVVADVIRECKSANDQSDG